MTRQPGVAKKTSPTTARMWMATMYKKVGRSPADVFHHEVFQGSVPRVETMGVSEGRGARSVEATAIEVVANAVIKCSFACRLSRAARIRILVRIGRGRTIPVKCPTGYHARRFALVQKVDTDPGVPSG